MNIERIDPEQRWSEAVVHNETIYYTSVPENLDEDATAQTANALAAIDVLLARVGSDKAASWTPPCFSPTRRICRHERRLGRLGGAR